MPRIGLNLRNLFIVRMWFRGMILFYFLPLLFTAVLKNNDTPDANWKDMRVF